MSKPVFIYTLLHPVTKEVRYVGKTCNAKSRLQSVALAAIILVHTKIFKLRKESSGVDDEYSRGFFNCLAIMQKRERLNGFKADEPHRYYPYWDECKSSYLKNIDLYNYWDDHYLLNENDSLFSVKEH